MHTVELLEEAIALAQMLGYEVRLEALDGHAGSCVVAGRKLLLVDLAASPAERLDTVLDALREESFAKGFAQAVDERTLSPALRRLVVRRRAA
ncbi:MAG: hypothetical protein WD875_12730 [Pirellulales bacterium]